MTIRRTQSCPSNLYTTQLQKATNHQTTHNNSNINYLVDEPQTTQLSSTRKATKPRSLVFDQILLKKRKISWESLKSSTLDPIAEKKIRSAGPFSHLTYDNLQNIDSFLSPKESFSLSRTCKLLAGTAAIGKMSEERVLPITDDRIREMTRSGDRSIIPQKSVFSLTLNNIEGLINHPAYSRVFFNQQRNIKMPADLTDAHLAEMAKNGLLNKIEFLDMSGCQYITSQGFSKIPDSVMALRLSDCPQICNEDLRQIGSITKLISLELGPTDAITDAGLRHIGQMPNIQQLKLSYCLNTTHEAFTNLGTFTKLMHLDVSGSISSLDPVGYFQSRNRRGAEGHFFMLSCSLR